MRHHPCLLHSPVPLESLGPGKSTLERIPYWESLSEERWGRSHLCQ